MKLDEIKKLDDEALKNKVAELCGWVEHRAEEHPKFDMGRYWTVNGAFAKPNRLPDFTVDLNAMHEAEKVLAEHDAPSNAMNRYLYMLCVICGEVPQVGLGATQ
jgi:hypothetical protein